MKIGLCGFGKAGTGFVRHISRIDDAELVLALCRDESSSVGKTIQDITKIALCNPIVIEKISESIPKNKPDVIIDFSACDTTLKLIDFCVDNGINLVICPTDFSEEQLSIIKNKTYEGGIGTIFAPALTMGINVIMDYVSRLSRVFPDFNFEIIESHPLSKPRPTKTSQYISRSINRENVPVSSIRLDGYVGKHEIICSDGLERITLIHESCSREAFARGALFAARFISGKRGFYEINSVMRDYLLEGNSFYEKD